MESFYFTVTGLVFCILLMVVYFSKDKVNYLENKIYSIIVSVNFLSCVAEVWSFVLVKQGVLATSPMYLFSLKMLFLGFLSWIYFFTLYFLVVSVNNDKNDNLLKKIFKNSILIFILLSLIVLVLPISVTSVVGLLLPSGPSVNFLYICCALCILLIIVIMVKNVRKFKGKKYIPFYLLIVMFAVIILVQKLFPALLIINAAFVFITFVMYFTIENPDKKVIEELSKNRNLVTKTLEEKSNFLFITSGEMKRPIKEILELSNDYDNKKVDVLQGNMKYINNLSHYLSFQVNNMMDASTLNINDIKVSEHRYNLNKLVNQIGLQIKDDLQENVNFNLNIDSNIPEYLYGDDILIKQVIMSFLNNSIKYTKNGFVDLSISAIKRYDLCRLIIRIEDTGIGMGIDKVNDLLMIDDELTENEIQSLETNNLNINTIKKVLNKLGGYFTIKSELDKGTEVKIIIDQVIDISKEVFEDKYDQTEKVLIASDDKKVISSLRKILNDKNYLIETSIYSADVVNRIHFKENYKYIIIDDGIKGRALPILMELKKNKNFDIPTFIIIGNDTLNISEHYIKDGFKDYFLKDNLEEDVNKKLD